MDQPLKVLHLVAGSLSGGAARGVIPVHRALLKMGVDSVMLVDHGEVWSDPSIISTEVSPGSKFARQLRWHIDALPLKFYPARKRTPFSPGVVGARLHEVVERVQPDIINLHWVNAAFVNITHLRNLKRPVVWTLRDLWPITGGCHYPLDCDHFTGGCGRCPQLGSERHLDLTRFLCSRKRCAYDGINLTFVGISKWVSDCANRSSVSGGARVETILNCINTSAFYPVNKVVAREILKLPTDLPIVLFGAQNPKDSYKGYDSLVAFLRIVESEGARYHIATFGAPPTDLLDQIRLSYTTFGHLHDDLSLRLVYSAADVFVAPSHQEAFGKTIAEALACGTPAVAYDIGGPQEIIQHRKTGYLSRPFEPSDIAEGVRWVLENGRCDDMASLCHKSVEKAFSPDRAAAEYLGLYKDILYRSRCDEGLT